MKRPYVMVHMMTSVDGRIDCPVMAQLSGNEYYDALDLLGPCSKLSGRVTAALECTAFKAEHAAHRPGRAAGRESVHVAHEADEYTLVVDTHGRLEWQAASADGHPLLCLLSEDVTEEHLSALRAEGISWIVTGRGHIDLKRALALLSSHFGVQRVCVVGGGHICGGFLEAGLVDEVSIMVAPGIDGREGQTSVFDGIRKADNTPYRLHLLSLQQWTGTDVVWLRYGVER